MKTLVLDTHKVISLLQKKGFTTEQAEGLVAAVKEADLSGMASATDIANLRIEIYKVAAAQTLVIVGAMIALAIT